MSEKFWVAGKHTVKSIIKNKKREIYKIVSSDPILAQNIKGCELVNKNFFKKIFKDQDLVHQNIAIQIKNHIQSLKDNLENINNILVLDNVTDPRNIGSIIRSASAFGIQGIILKKGTFNQSSPLMFKSASGATEKIKIFNEVNLTSSLELLKKNNFWVYGLDSNAKKIITKKTTFSRKNVFVFGSEEKGISNLVKKNCDELLKINILNIESLNISNAVAATLAIFNLV